MSVLQTHIQEKKKKQKLYTGTQAIKQTKRTVIID